MPTEEMEAGERYEVLLGPPGEVVELQVSTDTGLRTVDLEWPLLDTPW